LPIIIEFVNLNQALFDGLLAGLRLYLLRPILDCESLL